MREDWKGLSGFLKNLFSMLFVFPFLVIFAPFVMLGEEIQKWRKND